MPVSIVLLALPLAGLVVLLLEPDADAHWLHRPAHFWLILLTAVVNVVLGLGASEAARRRGDARATLVSLAFLACAGFLALTLSCRIGWRTFLAMLALATAFLLLGLET